MLDKFFSDHTEDWDDFLPYLVCAYNATAHSGTNCTANLLMLERETTLPVFGMEAPTPEGLCPVTIVDCVKNANYESFTFAWNFTKKTAIRQKRGYDMEPRNFKQGVGYGVYTTLTS